MRQCYTFQLKSGVQMRMKFSYEEFSARVKNGKMRLGNGEFAELVSQSPTLTTGNLTARYPMKSDAAGINPDQIDEARAYDAKICVPTDYDPETGQVIYESAGHRKRHLEAHGMYDRNGSYSDPQRLSGRERENRSMVGRSVHASDD